ncbi:MAG: ANTAR domain-containing protein [Oscillospiraceae bacterium]|jgi:response regulator NasT|nr:ANTAR domain-containing protein [Oscillospiraceae bacterium]
MSERVLIVSGSDKGGKFFSELFPDAEVEVVCSAEIALSCLAQSDYSLLIVDTPLKDEFGTSFAIGAAKKTITFLIVKKERFEQTEAIAEPRGVITLAKPINIMVFNSVLKTLRSLRRRIEGLTIKLEDTKLFDRAKLTLVANLKITEPEAHRLLERQAMNMRISKREVALGILKTYDENKLPQSSDSGTVTFGGK